MLAVCRAGSGLCKELITHSEEPCQALCVLTVYDLETSTERWPVPKLRCCVLCSIAVFTCSNTTDGMDVGLLCVVKAAASATS